MNHGTKRNVTLALLAATITPWAYPSTTARRTSPYAGFGIADITSAIASREQVRADTSDREASSALDARSTLAAIRNSTHDDRARIADTVEAAVDAASRAVRALQDRIPSLPDSSRSEFQRAMRSTLELEAKVRGGIATLRASTAENHANARDELASDYESYASAVGELEAISKNAVGTF